MLIIEKISKYGKVLHVLYKVPAYRKEGQICFLGDGLPKSAKWPAQVLFKKRPDPFTYYFLSYGRTVIPPGNFIELAFLLTGA
jgi:hypothetical protein